MESSMADSDAEKTIRELLPKLLKERPSFRYEVEDILSDRLVVKDEIKAILESIDKRFDETNKRFEETIEEMHQGFKENAREHQALLEKIDKSNKSIEETIERMDRGFGDMHRELGGMGGILGAMHEGLYVPKVIEAFERRHGLAATSLRNVEVGEQGHTEEVDALVHDGTVWVLEVSATVRNSDVDRAGEKAEKVSALPEFQGKKVVPVVAGTRIPDSVRARAQEAGVEVFKE